MSMLDPYGRQITNLRISVTNRCNFRCVYCRSADPENHLSGRVLLRWKELNRLARRLVELGIREIRAIVMEKGKGHRINEVDFVPPSRTMVFIGG